MFELNFTFETLEELIYFINNKFENQKIKKLMIGGEKVLKHFMN